MKQAAAIDILNPPSRHGRGAWRVLALAPLALLAGCDRYDFGEIFDGLGGAGHGGGSGGGTAICELDGDRYLPGESFPSSDGCNQCFCGEDGSVGCTERACINFCGGLTGGSCPEGQYCSFAPEAQCGAADQTGECAIQPQICTRQFDPVCGCDDVTYGNACEAASAGVSVSYEGECASYPACQSDFDCPVPPCACLDEDGNGVCENQCPVPRCVRGQCTYEIPTTLQLRDSCGGFRPAGSPDCDRGFFCQHQPGALCGAADAPGECVAIAEVCADVFDPVCGCDGRTYSNACEAAANQAGILDVGFCP